MGESNFFLLILWGSCNHPYTYACTQRSLLAFRGNKELFLEVNMADLKKVAAIMKVTLDEEENLQLHQFLSILQTHVDKVKDKF